MWMTQPLFDTSQLRGIGGGDDANVSSHQETREKEGFKEHTAVWAHTMADGQRIQMPTRRYASIQSHRPLSPVVAMAVKRNDRPSSFQSLMAEGAFR